MELATEWGLVGRRYNAFHARQVHIVIGTHPHTERTASLQSSISSPSMPVDEMAKSTSLKRTECERKSFATMGCFQTKSVSNKIDNNL